MEISVTDQLIEAVAALILGFGAGIFYDVLRVVRRRLRIRVVTYVCDFVFCVVIGVALLVLALTIGGGKARALLCVLAGVGAAVYFALLSRAVTYIFEGFADLVGVFFGFCVLPMMILIKSIKKIALFLKNLFNYSRRWYIFNERRFFKLNRRRRN